MMSAEIIRLAAFGGVGVVLGAASFASLRLNTSLYLKGDLWPSIGLHVLRLALMSGALVLVALQGAGPLIAVAAGLALVRPVAMRWGGKAR